MPPPLGLLQVSCRIRCYVVLCVVLLNREGLGWKDVRQRAIVAAAHLEGGSQREVWAKSNAGWAAIRKWAANLPAEFPACFDGRGGAFTGITTSVTVPTRKLFSLLAQLLHDLGHDVACLSFPWATFGTEYIPRQRVRELRMNDVDFERSMRNLLGLKHVDPPKEEGAAAGNTASSPTRTARGNSKQAVAPAREEEEEDDEDAPPETLLPPAPSEEELRREDEERRREQERREREAQVVEGLDLVTARRRAAEAFWAKRRAEGVGTPAKVKGGEEGPVVEKEEEEGPKKAEGEEEGQACTGEEDDEDEDEENEGEGVLPAEERFFISEVLGLVERIEAVGAALQANGSVGSEAFQRALTAPSSPWADEPSLEGDVVEVRVHAPITFGQ